MAIELTDADFQSTIEGSDKAVLVDFWAVWCGPCKHQGMILEKWAEQNADKVVVAKVNVDNENAIASKFGISSIPTLILFNKGQEVTRKVGVQSDADLDELVGQV